MTNRDLLPWDQFKPNGYDNADPSKSDLYRLIRKSPRPLAEGSLDV
ncbi:MAG: hypothetical protein IPH05_04665 [Flavobacteriales bacterium]|nr:hypothetical protein [Flavobacteriales bacterium]MBK7112261.1 hypothetical protein [Flavobacteriales bacterium]MBK7481733.1 hypothetical protein [Flavobacteriales bacterium]